MESITKINLNLQSPNYSVVVYAVQGDVMSREITALLYDGQTAFTPPVGALGTVRYMKPDGTSGFYDTLEDDETVAVTWDGNVATIRLAEQALTVAGEVILQLSFYSQDAQRLSAFNFRLFVEKNPLNDEEFESTDYYSVLTARIAAVLGAVAHAPQINDDGHWVLWDEDAQEYYDSGVEATGPQGIQGPVGPQGVSITNTSKASGTGEPGTTDTYNVNLSNGTVAGSFNVYNGQDGQGAPGSQTPQMDGTASSGSALAYSREDHVHPNDTSKANVADTVTGISYVNGVLKQTKNGATTDIFTTETTPTQNSTNPAASGEVYKAFRDVIEVTLEDVSSASRSFNVTGITADHELVQKGYAYLSNPVALGSDLTLTTGNGTIEISGVLSGATDIIATFGIKAVKATGSEVG